MNIGHDLDTNGAESGHTYAWGGGSLLVLILVVILIIYLL